MEVKTGRIGHENAIDPLRAHTRTRDRVTDISRPIRPGDQIRLIPAAQFLWPDIGARVGMFLRLDGWAVCRFGEIEVRVPADQIEAVA